MAYAKWRQVEEKYGKPMRDVLVDLYRELHTHQAVADELGVTLKGLWEWRRDSGCRTVTRIVCDTEPAATSK